MPEGGSDPCPCVGGSRCAFAAAVACGWRDEAEGVPFEIVLEPGTHSLAQPVRLDSRLKVGHLSIVAASIAAPVAASAAAAAVAAASSAGGGWRRL